METLYCNGCRGLTNHHRLGNIIVRCAVCNQRRLVQCSHDLVEPDATGHLSCVDCRHSFER